MSFAGQASVAKKGRASHLAIRDTPYGAHSTDIVDSHKGADLCLVGSRAKAFACEATLYEVRELPVGSAEFVICALGQRVQILNELRCTKVFL